MISMNKKYRTRSGLPVRILCTDLRAPKSVVVAIERLTGQEFVEFRLPNGRISDEVDTPSDLIETTPWDDYKIDTPVKVINPEDSDYTRGHFAGVIDGFPSIFPSGKTSWTAETEDRVKYMFCTRD